MVQRNIRLGLLPWLRLLASVGIRRLGDVCFQRTVSDVGTWTRPLIGWSCVLVCPGQSRFMARVDCCMLTILVQLYLTFHSQKYLNMDDIYIYHDIYHG